MLNSSWWMAIATVISLVSGEKINHKDIQGLCKGGRKWIAELICNCTPSSDNPDTLNEKEIPGHSWGLKSSLPGPCMFYPSSSSRQGPYRTQAESRPSGPGLGSGTGLEKNANLTPVGSKHWESGRQAPLFCIVGNNCYSVRNTDKSPCKVCSPLAKPQFKLEIQFIAVPLQKAWVKLIRDLFLVKVGEMVVWSFRESEQENCWREGVAEKGVGVRTSSLLLPLHFASC